MRILFISSMLIAADIARRLHEEGNEVKLYIDDATQKKCFDGLVPKTNNWQQELDWVGKDGLIVFDDVGFGAEQDKLRASGYTVFGGSKEGEKLETHRSFGQRIFDHCGMNVLPTHEFTSFSSAKAFIHQNPAQWVVKYDGHTAKHLSLIGAHPQGTDVLHSLLYAETYFKKQNVLPTITLQQVATGVEVGVGRFFNGKEWIGPIEYNIEHTRLFQNNVGPVVDEMGTLAWYAEYENELLYTTALAPLASFLRATNFRGDVSVNTIINEDSIHPIEATMRFGSPIAHLQTTLHNESWLPFLLAVARGETYQISYKRGFGIVLFAALPPFPYVFSVAPTLKTEAPIMYHPSITLEERQRIHFEEVTTTTTHKKDDTLFAPGPHGYCLYTTGHGTSVRAAREHALTTMKKIYIPKMMYRNDIGVEFEQRNRKKLKKYGIMVPEDINPPSLRGA
jgi:phosphoribosylamine---glycine ligase